MSSYTLSNNAADIDAAISSVVGADAIPTGGSQNMITSGGVRAYVDGLVTPIQADIADLKNVTVTRRPISSPTLAACTQNGGIKYIYAGLSGSVITYYNQHGGSNAVEAHGYTSFPINNSINVGVSYNTIVGVTVRVTIEQVTNTGGGFKGVTFLTENNEIIQQNMMPYTLPSNGSTATTTVGYVYVPVVEGGMSTLKMWADYFYGRGLDRVTIRAGLTHLYVS